MTVSALQLGVYNSEEMSQAGPAGDMLSVCGYTSSSIHRWGPPGVSLLTPTCTWFVAVVQLCVNTTCAACDTSAAAVEDVSPTLAVGTRSTCSSS